MEALPRWSASRRPVNVQPAAGESALKLFIGGVASADAAPSSVVSGTTRGISLWGADQEQLYHILSITKLV